MKLLTFLGFIFIVMTLRLSRVKSQHNPHWTSGRSVMVHLFEWKWSDIANECETFLAPNGYAGVQVSPPSENTIIGVRPWWERYQPVSYVLTTRSGTESSFVDMSRRCNAVGVRIYVDLILNHMSATSGVGTAGNTANAATRDFPAVPFTSADFHPPCEIDWNDANSIRRCQLVGLPDLDQSRENVRASLAAFMNHLIQLGVAGFRVDAMKHMEPSDLANIFSRLNNLNTNFGFASNSKAFIVGEVIYGGSHEPIQASEYFSIGTVTEFRYSNDMSRSFRGQSDLKWLRNFGEGWDFVPSNYALTFVDNHDNQRGGALSYKDGRLYKMATAFHLAWPYGIARVMSSFAFDGHDQGPPQDANGNLVSPVINADGSCSGGWVCEHRWREIRNMVGFKNVVGSFAVQNWWDNEGNMIAFGRGNRGFIAFNGQYGVDMNERLQTGLAAGTYCDVISGQRSGLQCTGANLVVDSQGFANVIIPSNHATGVIAIHIDARL